MIPRDGGNKLNGSFFAGFQNQSFQSDNLTDALKARGLKSADGIRSCPTSKPRSADRFNKDKIWFFLSARTFHLNTLPADVFNADGSAGVDPQNINSAQARIIWQISQKNKLAVYNDRLGKNRGAAMTAGFDPATAVDRVELADLLDGVGETHVHRDQQAPLRRRLLDQLRALQQPLPAGHRQGARHPRVVHHHQQAGHVARHATTTPASTSPGSILTASLRRVACRT